MRQGGIARYPAYFLEAAHPLGAGLPPFDDQDLFQVFDCEIVYRSPIRHDLPIPFASR